MGQNLFTTVDPWTASGDVFVDPGDGETDSQQLLLAFAQWAWGLLPYSFAAPTVTYDFDNVMLFTHLDLNDFVIGIAFVGGMCNELASASVSTANLGAGISSVTIAHEMGHNFGMGHDGIGE